MFHLKHDVANQNLSLPRQKSQVVNLRWFFFLSWKTCFLKKNNRWEELIKFAFPTAFIQELIKTKFVSLIGGETVRPSESFAYLDSHQHLFSQYFIDSQFANCNCKKNPMLLSNGTSVMRNVGVQRWGG